MTKEIREDAWGDYLKSIGQEFVAQRFATDELKAGFDEYQNRRMGKSNFLWGYSA